MVRLRTTAAIILLSVTALAGCSSGTDAQNTGTLDYRAAGTPGDTSPALSRFYSQHLTWSECSGHAGFQCSTVEVPLDYARPGGTAIRLAINRLPATGSRAGSLLTNPGGPGGSGLDYVYGSAAKDISAGVRARYDVIGIDPRGVGESSPVRCLSDQQLDTYYTVDMSPQGKAAKSRLRSAAQEYAAACKTNSGGILPYVSTVNAARDLDVVRAVLGDDALNYLGISYGTELGQVYAQLFPRSVGRMVLDSVVDPTLSAKESAVTQMAGVQRTFVAFVDDCLKQAGCPLGKNRKEGLRRVQSLLTRLAKTPLKSSSGRPVTATDARIALITATYGPELWQYARQALTMALSGDGTGLRVLADSYRERGTDGHYSNMQAANLAIGCLETPAAARTEKADQAVLAATRKVSPLFGGLDLGLPCAFWSVAPVKLPTAKVTNPILLLNNLGDNATPIEWARAVAKRLPRAVLVTNDESGHGVYGRGPCVNAAVDTYLLSGKLPAKATTCKDRGSLS